MKTHFGIMTANGLSSKQNFPGDSELKVPPGDPFLPPGPNGLLLVLISLTEGHPLHVWLRRSRNRLQAAGWDHAPQSNRWAKCDVDFCLHGPKMSCRAWSDNLQLDGVAGLSQPCRLPASSHPSSEGGPPMRSSLEPKSQPRQY